MKYMTFNNSCSYAGVANLLLDYSIDIEDYEIAIKTKVPYIFKYDDHCKRYISGSMLQEDKYYNFYLQNLGLNLIGNRLSPKEAIKFLNNLKCNSMIGLNVLNGSKHALIYNGFEDDKYIFMNNKRRDSNAPDFYQFSLEELLNKMDDTVCISYLEKKHIDAKIDLSKEMKASSFYLKQYENDILTFCNKTQNIEALNKSMNTLFHAFFLDVYSMMAIIEENQLCKEIEDLRTPYLKSLKLGKSLKLCEYISIECFKKAINDYENILHTSILVDL